MHNLFPRILNKPVLLHFKAFPNKCKVNWSRGKGPRYQMVESGFDGIPCHSDGHSSLPQPLAAGRMFCKISENSYTLDKFLWVNTNKQHFLCKHEVTERKNPREKMKILHEPCSPGSFYSSAIYRMLIFKRTKIVTSACVATLGTIWSYINHFQHCEYLTDIFNA